MRNWIDIITRTNLTEGKVEHLPLANGDLRIYVNPTRSDLINILQNTPDLRGIADDTNVYFFDALQTTHIKAERALMKAAMISERAYPIECLFLCSKRINLSSSYGSPRLFEGDFVMRCENRWEECMRVRNFARLMPKEIMESVDSDAFRRWFGNSKVVDSKGEPLVVYHGTNQNFEKFSHDRLGMSTGANGGAMHGFFFTNEKGEAEQYALNAGSRVVSNIDHFEKESERLRKETERLEKAAHRTGNWDPYYAAMQAWEDLEIGATREDPTVGATVLELYLSIQNPAVVDFGGGYITGAGDFDDIIRKAKETGHDGLILRDINDSPKGGFVSTQYVIFKASQAKVVANHGTYDPADDRFHH